MSPVKETNKQDTMSRMLPLEDSIVESKICIDHLLNNDYSTALELCQKLSNRSLYHNHGYSLLLWLKAYLTLEMSEIQKAQEASIQTLRLCETFRSSKLKNGFFYKFFFKSSYETLNDVQLHAELIHNEQILCSTLMEFFLDQSILVLIKVSYRLRSAYLFYKSLAKVINEKEWETEVSRKNFISAFHLGMGMFNMTFSMLPYRIVSLLSWVGFKGSRNEALRLLKMAGFATETIRAMPAQMLLCFYETFFEEYFSPNCTSAPTTEKLIQLGLKNNPNCIWFAHFKGKLHMIQNDIKGAKDIYEDCLANGRFDVPQVVIIYQWDLMWCSVLSHDWLKAVDYCHKLQMNCTWSKATLYYMQAAYLLMEFEKKLFQSNKDYAQTEEGLEAMKKIDECLKKVPISVIRYAGRRIPVEKFACERVEHYRQTEHFTLPAFELLLVWNTIIFIEGQECYLNQIIDHVNKYIEYYQPNLDGESYLICNLIKGVAFRQLHQFDKAELILSTLAEKIEINTYEPYQCALVCLELGIVNVYQHRFEEAKKYLLKARNDNGSYSLELIIMFRAHKAFELLKKFTNETS